MDDRRWPGSVVYFAPPGRQVVQPRACFPGRCPSLLHLAPSGSQVASDPHFIKSYFDAHGLLTDKYLTVIANIETGEVTGIVEDRDYHAMGQLLEKASLPESSKASITRSKSSSEKPLATRIGKTPISELSVQLATNSLKNQI